MYVRTPRFRKPQTSTPARVGPATYFLSDIFDGHLFENVVPFNSASIRTSAFESKNLSANPSPNKYKICFRKNRIVGGTSLQNTAPRMKYKVSQRTRGPYPEREQREVTGKVCVGVPPRGNTSNVTSIPEKGALGYEITDSGLVKISNPPMDRPIGPATYYSPQGHSNLTTVQYRGQFWSFRTAQRFRPVEQEGPGPAAYSGDQPPSTSHNTAQDINKALAPLVRSDDAMLRKLCREGFPGPGAYSPFDPNTKKCECGKKGTFAQAEREGLGKADDGPGPAAYTDPRTAIKAVTAKRSPFNVDAQRFPQAKTFVPPGPDSYSPQGGLWHDLQKRVHSKYARWNAPFDASATRKMSLAHPDSGCIPGPDWYNPQLQTKGGKKSTLATAPRDKGKSNQISPGPAAYSVSDPFKAVTDPKSHIQDERSSFLSTASRLKPLMWSYTPGPDKYHITSSTLSTKGCSITVDHGPRRQDVTPGPPDYTVHPKYARSSLFHTHNVTLQPSKTAMTRRPQKQRRFSK